MLKLSHTLLVSQILLLSCSTGPPKRFENVEDPVFVRDEMEELYEEYEPDFDDLKSKISHKNHVVPTLIFGGCPFLFSQNSAEVGCI